MRRILFSTLVAYSFINHVPTHTLDYKQTYQGCMSMYQNCMAYAKPYVQKLTGAAAESHFWKTPLFWGALCTAGTTVALIAYCYRFNLNDAHNLITEINEFNEYAHLAYSEEFEQLNSRGNDEKAVEILNTIILGVISPTPYLDYVHKAQQNLEKCQSFYKTISYGIVKINAAYNKAAADPETSVLLLDEYEHVIQELSNLQKIVRDLANSFGALCIFCWQNNACKQEMVYAQLKELNRTMHKIEMNTLFHNLGHNTTVIYTNR